MNDYVAHASAYLTANMTQKKKDLDVVTSVFNYKVCISIVASRAFTNNL
jgi:hypothetical protein